jgi:hypothetical protein
MLVYVFYTRTEHTPGGISGTYTISVCLWFFTTALFDTKKTTLGILVLLYLATIFRIGQ